jgi:hypothetical protein
LQVRLSSDDKRQLAKRATKNSEAYHLYLKGRFFVNKVTLDIPFEAGSIKDGPVRY